eukprot:UN11728
MKRVLMQYLRVNALFEIADLETELEQQVNLVYHLEQERIAISND